MSNSNLPTLLIDLPRNPIFAVGLPVTVGVLNGFLTRKSQYGPESLWYKGLKKPSLNPPRHYFGIVWPALYVGMGYASHLTVKALDRTPPGFGRDKALHALTLYWAQLALNAAWSPVTFGFGQLGLGLVNLGALTGTIGYWIASLKEVDINAAYLMIPYAAWSVFATYLNASLWWNNSGRNFYNRLVNKAKDV
ncbi:TspO/MBR-related protein [Violaceomyces palustris]|uniref:TspO/MBR-related protein n=1 Tax=Violaceomyces palustris TaxID=1673888 RepID=A0ACD0NZ42_9BASI|nr:TspO/MBR-related protein [Violaceomyces palustris]